MVISITNLSLVCIMLLSCMLADTEQQISVFFPEEDHLSCYWLSIVAYIFLCVGLRPHRLFSIQFGVPLDIILV